MAQGIAHLRAEKLYKMFVTSTKMTHMSVSSFKQALGPRPTTEVVGHRTGMQMALR